MQIESFSDEESYYSYSEDENEIINNNEFDEDFYLASTITAYPKPISEIPAGLNNCGESCFINSSLQIIFQIPFICNVFAEPNDTISDIASSLINLYYEAQDSTFSINPIAFFSILRKKNQQFVSIKI